MHARILAHAQVHEEHPLSSLLHLHSDTLKVQTTEEEKEVGARPPLLPLLVLALILFLSLSSPPQPPLSSSCPTLGSYPGSWLILAPFIAPSLHRGIFKPWEGKGGAGMSHCTPGCGGGRADCWDRLPFLAFCHILDGETENLRCKVAALLR